MCGIIGYASKNLDSCSVALSCLKNLEYRGYDSSGVATSEQGKINMYKAQGKIANLEEKIKDHEIFASTAIAHTRWATHGEPSETNAHPHKVGHVTLVHNGIIENYSDIKQDLLSKGMNFVSETDSEVACGYINYMYEQTGDKMASIKAACDEFRGSYALPIIFDDEPNTIYSVRKNSPLIVGLSDNGNFVSSDVSAILNYTNKYMLLDNDEYVKVTNDSVEIFDSNLNKIDKPVDTATWSAVEYQKNGYDHFMLKEIHEQPKVVKNILGKFYDEINFTKYDNIHIVACGSAMHAGMVAKYLLENNAKVRTTVEIASEYRYKENLITPSTLVIIISQSGETADTLAALRLAKEQGAYVLAIVNVVGSSIAREADKTIYTYAGPEIAVATTKGYSSQVATLTNVALTIMKQKGLLQDSVMDTFYKDVEKIESLAEDLINSKDMYKAIANKLYTHENVLFIGRGIDSASCMEGSLKLKEISYIHSEAYAAGELKHGTISLVDQGTPVITIATVDNLYEKTISNLKETKARGAYTLLITTENQNVDNIKDSLDDVIILPKVSEYLQAILVVIVLQLIAYETAILRGADIDKPKNLAKSVTVE